MAGKDDHGAFIWYELLTGDVETARNFYRSVIGWEIADQGNALPDGATYRMIGRSDGGHAGGVMTITDAMRAQGARSGWLAYVNHSDVDAAVAQIVDAGGSVHRPAVDMPGVGRMALIADPQGAVIYVMAPTPPADDPDATSDVFDPVKPQHFRWNELQTRDPVAAARSYGDLFGWRQEGSLPMGEMGDYLFLTHDGTAIGAMMASMGDEPPHWLFYAGVDDIDRAASAVVSGGGQITVDIMEIPGGEFSLVAVDPQGAAIGLVGPRKGVG